MRVLVLGVFAGIVLLAGTSTTEKARIEAAYSSLPLDFEANAGQANGAVKYLARRGAYSLSLRATGAELRLPGGAVSMRLNGSLPSPEVVGLDALPGKVNYFLGNDPRQWHTNIPTYAKVKYRNVYPGIDLIFYGHGRELEYDFVVAPGADPELIHLTFGGAGRLNANSRGDITVRVGKDQVRMRRPIVYQLRKGSKVRVEGQYAQLDGQQVAFHLGVYDRSEPLVIDPVLDYASYLGGSSGDSANAIAIDSAGAIYLTGLTRANSSGFPIVNAVQSTAAGWTSAFVAKLNPGGSALLYSTYLGGRLSTAQSSSSGTGIAVDSGGAAYVTGSTSAGDFPTLNPLQASLNGSADVFVAKLSPSGALAYSTYYGGPGYDYSQGIAVDSSGSAYITGDGERGVQPPFVDRIKGFVAKLSPSGSTLVYATPLAGAVHEQLNGLALDLQRNVYVTGGTSSPDFPVTGDAIQPHPSVLPAYRTGDAGKTWSGAYRGLGALVSAFAVDPQSPGTVYAAGVGGVFKSTDAGETWSEADSGISISNRRMHTLAIDPPNPSTLYTSSAQAGLFDPPAAAYRSTNGGASWSEISFFDGPLFGGARAFAIDPSTSTVYAATVAGILKSDDGGGTWKSTGLNEDLWYLSIDPSHPSTLYANPAQGGLWKSDDGGAHWAALDGAPATLFSIVVNPSDSSVVYGVTGDGIVCRSANGGISWAPVYNAGAGGVSSLVIDATGSNIYLGGSFGIFKSADGGASWERAGFVGTASALAVDPTRSGAVYAASFGGYDAFLTKLDSSGRIAYSTFLGGSGPDEGHAVAVDADGSVYITGTTGSVDFPLVNAAQTALAGVSNTFVAKISASGAKLIYSTYLGGAESDFAQAIAVDSSGSAFVTGSTLSLDFPTKAPIQAAFSGGVVSKSVNSAANWSSASQGLLHGTVHVLATSKATPSLLFAGQSDGVSVSRDGGGSWTATTLTHADIRVLAIDLQSPSTIYAGGPSGLFQSRDTGATWRALNLGPALSDVTALAIDPVTPSTIYASTTTGIFKTTDRGANWAQTTRTPSGATSLEINRANPSILYALAWDEGYLTLFKSQDAAATWTVVSEDIGYDTGTLVMDPVTSSTLYLAIDGGILKSIDSGRNFDFSIGLGSPCYIGALAIDPDNPANLYAGGGSGLSCVLKSTDAGGSWTRVDAAPGGVSVLAMIVDPSATETVYTVLAPASDSFVTKLSPDGSSLVYSTYIGGRGVDTAFGIALDASGSAWVVGNSTSVDFPTVNALQPNFGGDTSAYFSGDAFVVKIKE